MLLGAVAERYHEIGCSDLTRSQRGEIERTTADGEELIVGWVIQTVLLENPLENVGRSGSERPEAFPDSTNGRLKIQTEPN